MHPIFQDMPEVEYFIDDIGLVTSDDFENLLTLLHHVLLRLKESVFFQYPPKMYMGCPVY